MIDTLVSMPESESQSRRLIWALRRAFLAVEAEKESRLRHTGVSPAHYAVLINVQVAEGLTAAELARRLHLTPQNVGGLVTKLVGAGWLERRLHPQHRHVWELYLTDAGAEALREAEAVVHDVELSILDTLADDEIEPFRAALESVAAIARSGTP